MLEREFYEKIVEAQQLVQVADAMKIIKKYCSGKATCVGCPFYDGDGCEAYTCKPEYWDVDTCVERSLNNENS